MENLRKIIFVFLVVWLLVLFFRSGLFVTRIYSEAKNFLGTTEEQRTFLPEIKACSPKPESADEEKLHLWEYRNLKVECKK